MSNKTLEDYKKSGEYHGGQLEELEIGLKNNVDVSVFDNPEFTPAQMMQIRLGLEHGVDASIYANLMVDSIQMDHIRFAMEHGCTDVRQMVLQCMLSNKYRLRPFVDRMPCQ